VEIVNPERCFFTPPSKAGLGAAEWVNKSEEDGGQMDSPRAERLAWRRR